LPIPILPLKRIRAQEQRSPSKDIPHPSKNGKSLIARDTRDTRSTTRSTSTSTTIHSSSTLGSSESTTDKISNTAADVASHVSAAVGAGNPIHAAKYAGTAAMIGQVEREKHAHGPLEDEASIKAADATVAPSTSTK